MTNDAFDKTRSEPTSLSSGTTPVVFAAESGEADEEALRIGKDEMNLVEYPFAALSREAKTDAVIEHEWETRHPISKKLVKASWRVAGDPKRGLPTAIDERVYLAFDGSDQRSGLSRPGGLLHSLRSHPTSGLAQ